MSAEPAGAAPASLLPFLEVEQADRDVFVGRTPTVRRHRVFGGQVAAQAFSAAACTAPRDRPVHSLHAYFLRPGDPRAEIRYVVERIREGRSFSTRRVLALQGRGDQDVPIFALTAEFHQPEPIEVEHAVPMPAVAPPHGLHPPATEPGSQGDALLTEGLDRRPLPGAGDDGPAGPRIRSWYRVRERLPDDPVVHSAALAFVSDLGLLVAGMARMGGWRPGLAASSLDHALWFHRSFRADEWFLYESESPVAAGARALCFGRIWSADGTHVATVAQEGLIRRTGG